MVVAEVLFQTGLFKCTHPTALRGERLKTLPWKLLDGADLGIAIVCIGRGFPAGAVRVAHGDKQACDGQEPKQAFVGSRSSRGDG